MLSLRITASKAVQSPHSWPVLRLQLRLLSAPSRASFGTNPPKSIEDRYYDARHHGSQKHSKRTDRMPDFRWFYATDVPESMPSHYEYEKTETPKKFSPFSLADSKRIEKEFQKSLRNKSKAANVSVNEDYLFEVDITKRIMMPIYWEGAIYQVRRAIWFDDRGNPISEKLASSIENGYSKFNSLNKTGKKSQSKDENSKPEDVLKLEGFDEGKAVVFNGKNSAYLIHDLIGGDLQLQLYRALHNAPIPGATSLTRGYNSDDNKPSTDDSELKDDKKGDSSSLLNMSKMFNLELSQLFAEKTSISSEDTSEDNTKEAMKLEIENDYKIDDDKDDGTSHNDRPVDHLILCIHGIGQALGTKFQNVNFIHTINILRKNMKKVFASNKEFQKLLNQENDPNCKIQVLPISWRHKVDFETTKPFQDEKDEHGNLRLPSLIDMTVDDMKPLRNLLGAVILDVLLYYEPRYKNQILNEVVAEANRLYDLYKERNPSFKGKVSLIGHSLGSAVVFDILSHQPKNLSNDTRKDPKFLKFEVDNYFALGAPFGVFTLLKRQNIESRKFYPESTDEVASPKCENIYNVFHQCDPIGYRIEPLISPEFKKFKPESIPFLIEDFNKQLSQIARLGENFGNKVFDSAAGTWANVTSNKITKMLKAESEKSEESERKEDINAKEVQLSDQQLEKLVNLNYSGRVDYALQQGYLNLSLLSSISAHVSYFEDENVAAFIVQETLGEKKKVTQKAVTVLSHDEHV